MTLLPPRSRVIGDTAQMLTARARFFETGSYAPIAAAVADAGRSAGDRPHARVAEIGCGTGYYLGALSAALTEPEPWATDLSPAAVRTAVAAVPGAVGVVLDVWQPLPLAENSQDVLLSVFAPRNLPEFARVLSPGGTLIAVVPTAEHLREARAAGLALDVPAGKADDLERSASPWFDLRSRTGVQFPMDLAHDTLDLLLGMGPSSHHNRNARDRAMPGTVTASVTVLTFRRRDITTG